eukprot:m.126682 g.126682  ORF g.126682 m.126682 type:complete len:643 (-) comp17384_c0_seq1:1484-3412(-)
MSDIRNATDKVLSELADGDHAHWKHLDASVAFGKVRKNHGIEITISSGPITATEVQQTSKGTPVGGTLDLHGQRLFSALPNATGSIAEMMLPLTILLCEQAGEQYCAHFTLGAKKLSRNRLVSTLQHLVANGDPPFVFELRKNGKRSSRASRPELVGFLPTTASLILCGLQSSESSTQQSIRFNGDLPDIRKSRFRAVSAWLRWWLLPCVFLALSWMLWLFPQEILTRTPLLWNDTNDSALVDILPPHPTNMSSAFKLGGLREQLIFVMQGRNETDAAAVLAAAGHLAGRAVSHSQLMNMLEEIERVEGHQSIVTRVTGTFTFVNIMWFLAILGIIVSIGPSIYHILRPIREVIIRVAKRVYHNVIMPTVLRLHSWGAFEVVAYGVCFACICQGIRMKNLDAGKFVALTGALGVLPGFAYSTTLHGRRIGTDKLTHMVGVWLCCAWIPTALLFQSDLFGYLCVMAGYVALGFGVWAHPLCLVIGFDSSDSLQRCVPISALLSTALVFLRVSNTLDPVYLLPFTSAGTVMGNIVLLLGLLILSTWSYFRREKSGKFWFFNTLMILLLGGTQFAGLVLGLHGMANVATTFTALYILDKYAEWHLYHCKGNAWILLLLVSVSVWQGSLCLHNNPAFVASLFNAYK